MKIIKYSAFVFIFLLSSLYAQEEKFEAITTRGDKTYKSVIVTNITPSYIKIIHEAGITKIMLKDLPDDLQKKFNYDPEKAEVEINQELARKKEQQAIEMERRKEAYRLKKLLENAKAKKFSIVQTLENGMLVNNVTQEYSSAGYLYNKVGTKLFYVEKFPNKTKLADGTYIDGMFTESGTYSYKTVLGGSKTVTKYKYIAEKPKPKKRKK